MAIATPVAGYSCAMSTVASIADAGDAFEQWTTAPGRDHAHQDGRADVHSHGHDADSSAMAD